MNQFTLAAFADEAGKALDEQIDAMLGNGVSALEIRGIGEKNVADLTVEEAKEIRSRLEEKGLRVWSIGSPIGKVGVHEDFAPHMEKYLHVLELAKVLGASCIRLFSFYPGKEEDPEACREAVFSRLRCFVEAAKDTGIAVCHENEKGIYGDIAARCLEIFENVPGLHGIFDPANFVQCGQDTLQAWEMLHPYIKYMHIKDSREDGSIVPAGKGVGNVPAIVKAYGQQGGTVLTLEPHLFVFSGLAKLEREGEKSQVGEYEYPTQRDAFNASVNALKAIIG